MRAEHSKDGEGYSPDTHSVVRIAVMDICGKEASEDAAERNG